jgi:co-chaperonin GroES (HSP10)
MDRQITKLFGPRVAIEEVEENYRGLIIRKAKGTHRISKVLAKGDQVGPEIEVGDVLFWQTNANIENLCSHEFEKGHRFNILLTGDMIAKVKNQVIALDTFQVIGIWCLIRRTLIAPSPNGIVLPDYRSVEEANARWILEQKGQAAQLDVEPGQEVIIDRNMANRIELDQAQFAYIHRNHVLGAVAPK